MNTLACCRLLLPLTLLVSGLAQAEGFYLVGTLGQARGEVGAAEMDSRMADLGYHANASVDGQNRLSWSLLAGYQWSDYLATELGYTDLGEVTTHLSGQTDDIIGYLTSADAVHPRTADGIEVALVGRYPLTEAWALFARGGLIYADSSYAAWTTDQGQRVERGEQGGEWFWGGGIDYRLSERWALRGDWARYQIQDEAIERLGFSLIWHWQ